MHCDCLKWGGIKQPLLGPHLADLLLWGLPILRFSWSHLLIGLPPFFLFPCPSYAIKLWVRPEQHSKYDWLWRSAPTICITILFWESTVTSLLEDLVVLTLSSTLDIRLYLRYIFLNCFNIKNISFIEPRGTSLCHQWPWFLSWVLKFLAAAAVDAAAGLFTFNN